MLYSVLILFFLYFQLTRLQKENDSLIGKHSKYAEQLQNEDINLPNNMEVCHVVTLARVTPEKYILMKRLFNSQGTHFWILAFHLIK